MDLNSFFIKFVGKDLLYIYNDEDYTNSEIMKFIIKNVEVKEYTSVFDFINSNSEKFFEFYNTLDITQKGISLLFLLQLLLSTEKEYIITMFENVFNKIPIIELKFAIFEIMYLHKSVINYGNDQMISVSFNNFMMVLAKNETADLNIVADFKNFLENENKIEILQKIKLLLSSVN